MKCLTFLITFLLPLVSFSNVEYKDFPEYTAEFKDFRSHHALGIASDTENELSSQVSEARNFLMHLDKKVFQLKNGCSAIFTSNEGHAVTALHCLESLNPPLIEKKVIVESTDGSEITTNASIQNMEGQEYTTWPLTRARFKNLETVLPLKILALGKGYPDIKKSWTKTSEEVLSNLDVIKDHIDDYALIKLKSIPHGYSCAQISDSVINRSSISWTGGYPVQTRHHQNYLTVKTVTDLINKANFLAPSLSPFFRRALSSMRDLSEETWFSFEEKQHLSPFYISVGRVYSNFEQLRSEFSYPVLNENDQLFDLITDQNRYFVSTSFIKPGFSGGGVFDTEQRLLGVTTMSASTPSFLKTELKPLTSHVRIDYIKQKVGEKLGPEVEAQAFNCE